MTYEQLKEILPQLLREYAALTSMAAPYRVVLETSANEIERLHSDLSDTLRAVLHFYGPEGGAKVTDLVMKRRWEKENNSSLTVPKEKA